MTTSLKVNLICVKLVDTYIVVNPINKIYSIKLAVYSGAEVTAGDSEFRFSSRLLGRKYSISTSFWAPDCDMDFGFLSSLCSVYTKHCTLQVNINTNNGGCCSSETRDSSLI